MTDSDAAVSAGHTYFGSVSSVQEAHAILEASKQGLLPRVTRRLTDDERVRFVRPGAVFVWEEKESGIRRWTDQVKWSPSRVSGAFLTYTEMPPNGDETLIKQSFSSIDSQRTKMHLIAYTSRAAFASGSLPSAADDPLLQNLLRLRQQRDAGRDARWAGSNSASTSAKPIETPRPTTANSSTSTSSAASNSLSATSQGQTSASVTPTGRGSLSARQSPPLIQPSASSTSRVGSLSHQHSFPSYPLGSHAAATASNASHDPPRRALSVSGEQEQHNAAASSSYWTPSTSAHPAYSLGSSSLYPLNRPVSSSASSSTGNVDSAQSTRPSTSTSSTSAGLLSASPAVSSMRGWTGLNELDLDDREPHHSSHGYPRSLSTPSAYASSSTFHPPPTGGFSSRPTSSHHHPYPRPASAASQSSSEAARRLPPILRPVGLPAMTGDSPPMPNSAHSTQGSRTSPLRTSFDEAEGARRPRRSDEFGDLPEPAPARDWATLKRERDHSQSQAMPQIELPPLIPAQGMNAGWRDSEDERQLRLLGRGL